MGKQIAYNLRSMFFVALWCTLAIQNTVVGVDWLVQKITTPVTLTKSGNGLLRLGNGLIYREFSVSPNFATLNFYSIEKDQSLLRAFDAESGILLNNHPYNIGGILCDIPRAYLNRSALSVCKNDEMAFQYVSYKTMDPVAPFPYRPRRGAPKDIIWPPKGLRLDVEFKAPQSAPDLFKRITVIVHYEMYVGMPVLSKWISIYSSTKEAQSVMVAATSVEYLSVNRQWGNVAPGGFEKDYERGWLHVETDQSHGTVVQWQIDPSAKLMPGSFEPIVNCSYQSITRIPIGSEGFESFKVHELVVGSSDRQRSALARLRQLRILAPHSQENPIFFHMVKTDSKSVRGLIDQMSDVGFEMMIYSFSTDFNIESTNDTYIAQIAADTAYAKSKGIEVGGYDLIALSRKVKPEWMAVNSANQSIGSACFASGWHDFLFDRILDFINRTGFSMVETDGPYGGYACASTSHKHHTGAEDSVYIQQKLQGKFFSILRTKEVYINQPDYFFYQGGSRTGKSEFINSKNF